jgi:prolyl oligopeptidase
MPQAASRQPFPPVAANRVDVVELLGPHRIADPYRWLEDASDPGTVSWLAGQHELYQQARRGWHRRDWFRRRLDELTAYEECWPPVWRGPRAFYACRGTDDEHLSLRIRACTQAGEPGGTERTVVDPMRLDPAGRTTLDAWVPSWDGRLVACLFSTGGTEQAVLRVLDADSGAFVGSPVTGCRSPAVAWLPGRAAFYYVGEGPDGTGPRVLLHEAQGPAGSDPVVFGAGFGELTELDIVLDRTGQRLLVTVVTDLSSSTEIWLVEQPGTGGPESAGYRIAACPDGWSVVWPGNDGRLYLLTDHQAPRGQIMVADAAAARTDRGRTLVPEDPVAVIESMAVLDGQELARPLLVVARSQAGRSTLSCHDLRTGGQLWHIPLPGAGVVTELTCRQQGGHEAWFSYTDPLTPPAIYHYDATSQAVTGWRQSPAVSPRGVCVTEVRYPSADGTPVRMLLTRPAGASGPLPTILHAYGAFGEAQQPEYYPLALAWAEAGGILAIPYVRGGGEEGESWHEAGMLANKQRGIDDLIAAAEHLIKLGLAEPSAIGVKGFSAGGLLAAAAFIQRPELFAAAECTSPLLDMARYELTGAGQLWSGEFGSREDPEELGWMLDYSPYHNVADGTEYPAVLLATFDGDTRVDPMHARKMCAALQHATSSGRPVLLRTEPGVGHGGRSRSAWLGYFADVLGFFAQHLMKHGDNRPVHDRGVTGGGVPE